MIGQTPYMLAQFDPYSNHMKWELLLPHFIDKKLRFRVKYITQGHSKFIAKIGTCPTILPFIGLALQRCSKALSGIPC